MGSEGRSVPSEPRSYVGSDILLKLACHLLRPSPVEWTAEQPRRDGTAGPLLFFKRPKLRRIRTFHPLSLQTSPFGGLPMLVTYGLTGDDWGASGKGSLGQRSPTASSMRSGPIAHGSRSRGIRWREDCGRDRVL